MFNRLKIARTHSKGPAQAITNCALSYLPDDTLRTAALIKRERKQQKISQTLDEVATEARSKAKA
jgi:hypothetical protein